MRTYCRFKRLLGLIVLETLNLIDFKPVTDYSVSVSEDLVLLKCVNNRKQ